MTQTQIEARRKHQLKWYHLNKHTEAYKARKRKQGKRKYWTRVFWRMAKALRKHDDSSLITPFELWKIAKQQKLICPISGHRLTNQNMSPDHIIHRVNGGKTIPSNIRIVTIAVNTARNSMSDNELIKLCQDIVNHNKKTPPPSPPL